MLTYKQAYDKIIDAYFRGEIKPYDSQFCFCGTLCDKRTNWRKDGYGGIFSSDTHLSYMHYSGKNYADMERALLIPLISVYELGTSHPNYESVLFAGMSAALDVLKQIHIERGEVIDEKIPAFTKRELVAK